MLNTNYFCHQRPDSRLTCIVLTRPTWLRGRPRLLFSAIKHCILSVPLNFQSAVVARLQQISSHDPLRLYTVYLETLRAPLLLF